MPYLDKTKIVVWEVVDETVSLEGGTVAVAPWRVADEK